jgi:anti-anti-sigma regulatory factor
LRKQPLLSRACQPEQPRVLVRVQRQGQRLQAFGLSEHYRQIFALTRLDDPISIHDTEAAALARAEWLDGT